jgi:4a-hydroxytetrahydrobiopterin dehydratase
MKYQVLSQEALMAALQTLPGWQVNEDRLYSVFKFKDFKLAFACMTTLALYIEQYNHHPTWQNTYGQLEIYWTTHDAGGITELDVKLAKITDQVVAIFQKSH